MIDFYFAGSQCPEAEQIIEENGYCRLFSYFNDKSSLRKRFGKHLKNGKLFVDSGAFTAWTRGVKLDVDEYIKWLNDNCEEIYLAGQIDVIPGEYGKTPTLEQRYIAAKETWENYLYMRERLINPDMIVYTFHLGEDYNFLKNALQDTTIKYIALGGTVGSNVKIKEQFFEKCFEIIKNSPNPNVKVHAFGMTSVDLIQKFPFTSVDSTSWIMTGAVGNIFSKYGNIDLSKKNSMDVNSIFNLSEQHRKDVIEEIEKYGYTLEQLKNDHRARVCYNVKFLYNRSLTLKQISNNSFKKTLF